ncbi:MAG: hypothetical protein ACTSVY_00425 [Candidatus Helarchaeota archaeon]
MVKCPECGSEEYTEGDDTWCTQCKKMVKICYCDDCTTEFFSCGHRAPEKHQCESTKSTLRRV